MIVLLVVVPIMAAAVAFAIPSNRWRPKLLPVAAAVHLGLTKDAMEKK